MRDKMFLVLAAGLLAGCLLGPDYERPRTETRGAYRGAPPAAQSATRQKSLGELRWSQVFRDPTLQRLIAAALQRNLDVGIAAARVVQAEAQLGITRADQLPAISAGATGGRQRSPQTGDIPASTNNFYQLSATASWQLDFWGKYRRASEASRAELLAAEWAHRAVITTLVSDLAGAYFQLRELDLELEITRRTLVSRRESLALVQLQERQGTVSMLDVRQAEQLVFIAGQTITDLERRIAQQENTIRILLGANPGSVPRGSRLTEQPHDHVVPAGLPSALLTRRPDIRVAEERLVAANARIGVARAAYFPDIALTATGGFQSNALESLLDAPARLWSVAASLTQSIFAGGRVRAGVKLSEAQKQEALLVYRQTILQAFREVSDALVAYTKTREFREQQQQLTQSARDAAGLSDSRYRGGTASYLEVLDSNTRYFEAELGLAQAELAELLALVQLYRSLGGGWQGVTGARS
jgi:outer membrane protein, multidrug efflux system